MVGAWIGIFLGLNVVFNVLCKPLERPFTQTLTLGESNYTTTPVFPSTDQLQTGLDPQ